MGFLIFSLTIYFLFAIIGLGAYKDKELRELMIYVIGILLPILFFLYIHFSYPLIGGLVGAVFVFLLMLMIVILPSIIGFFSGICSRYFFENAKSSPRHSLTQNIIGGLILTWPLVALGAVQAVTYPGGV